MTNQLEEQIKAVAKARAQAKSLKTERDNLLEEWNKSHQDLLDALTQAGANVAELETNLRELTLQAFAETGNKAPAEGVSVKIFGVLSYDPKEALQYAKEHGVALKLDTTSFEKMAKISELRPSFVSITEEARAQIASNLSGE